MSPEGLRLDEAFVAEVVASLRALAGDAWTDVTWELQDDAAFLLVTVDLAERPLERNAPGRMQVFQLLGEKIPPGRGSGASWMVVFVHRGAVVDSLMTGAI
jgi:hypothetical protein